MTSRSPFFSRDAVALDDEAPEPDEPAESCFLSFSFPGPNNRANMFLDGFFVGSGVSGTGSAALAGVMTTGSSKGISTSSTGFCSVFESRREWLLVKPLRFGASPKGEPEVGDPVVPAAVPATK